MMDKKQGKEGYKKKSSSNTLNLIKRNRYLGYYKRIFNKNRCKVEKIIWNWNGWLLGILGHQFNKMFIKNI